MGTRGVLIGYSRGTLMGTLMGTPDLPLGRERERVDERPQPRHDPAGGEYSRSTASTEGGAFFGSYYIYYSRGTTLPTESTPAVRQVPEKFSLGVVIFIIAAARPCRWRVLPQYGKYRRRSFLWGSCITDRPSSASEVSPQGVLGVLTGVLGLLTGRDRRA
jgi:hypothetical protein